MLVLERFDYRRRQSKVRLLYRLQSDCFLGRTSEFAEPLAGPGSWIWIRLGIASTPYCCISPWRIWGWLENVVLDGDTVLVDLAPAYAGAAEELRPLFLEVLAGLRRATQLGTLPLSFPPFILLQLPAVIRRGVKPLTLPVWYTFMTLQHRLPVATLVFNTFFERTASKLDIRTVYM